MSTRAYSYPDEPWTHDWGYEVVGFFGDADRDPAHGVLVTITAGSPLQAEQRALTYLIANFHDPVDGRLESSADLEPISENRYCTRITWHTRP